MRINADITKKYSLEQVALLVMFAFGLLVAGLIVALRGRIGLSGPIELPHSGLAVSLPEGRGWERSAGWSYETPNEFNLSAHLRVGNQLAAVVHCRYLLASREIDPERVLASKMAAATLQATGSGQIINDVRIHWVQAGRAGGLADTFLGVAILPHGRVLEISVRAPTDPVLAGKVFRLIAEGIVFGSDELISGGVDFIRRFRNRGLGDIIRQQKAVDAENKWGAAYSVRVRFLLGGDAYVQSYFDFEKNLVGKIDKNQGVLYWHKSDRKTLAETFANIERYLGPPSVGR